MYKITANDWDGLNFNKVKLSYRNTKITNKRMMEIAEKYALKGRRNPSPLEKLMIEFLSSHGVKYEFQKPYCIYKEGVIDQFFIVDFYIPSKSLIIETDGKYHDTQVDYDNYRTKKIKEQYPGVDVIRWRFKDFHSPKSMEHLIHQLS